MTILCMPLDRHGIIGHLCRSSLCLSKLSVVVAPLHTSLLLSNSKGWVYFKKQNKKTPKERPGHLEMTCLLSISKQPTRIVLCVPCRILVAFSLFSGKQHSIIDALIKVLVIWKKASSNTWIPHEEVWLVHEIKEVPDLAWTNLWSYLSFEDTHELGTKKNIPEHLPAQGVIQNRRRQ
jgi:hypothetical protein